MDEMNQKQNMDAGNNTQIMARAKQYKALSQLIPDGQVVTQLLSVPQTTIQLLESVNGAKCELCQQ